MELCPVTEMGQDRFEKRKGQAVIEFLVTYLAVLVVSLAACMLRQPRPQVAGGIPAGYEVLAADLGGDAAMGGRGALLLRDDEWGIVGKADVLLRSSDGEVIIPVEFKSVWPGYEVGTARPSHILQLGAVMLLCQADGRVDRAPREGWIRYVDDRGQLVSGGEVAVPNTVPLRERVLELLRRMRRALVRGDEVHRQHRSPAKCRRCGFRSACGETMEP